MAKRKKIIKLTVELEIEGDDLTATYALLNDILDTGVLQDAINEHDSERCGPLKVTSALCSIPSDQSISTSRGRG